MIVMAHDTSCQLRSLVQREADRLAYLAEHGFIGELVRMEQMQIQLDAYRYAMGYSQAYEFDPIWDCCDAPKVGVMAFDDNSYALVCQPCARTFV